MKRKTSKELRNEIERLETLLDDCLDGAAILRTSQHALDSIRTEVRDLYAALAATEKRERSAARRNTAARLRRAGLAEAYASAGMSRVRGGLGGTYWE